MGWTPSQWILRAEEARGCLAKERPRSDVSWWHTSTRPAAPPKLHCDGCIDLCAWEVEALAVRKRMLAHKLAIVLP